MNWLPRPKVHQYAYLYGDELHDPWPGDLAMGIAWVYCNYRFDGQHWRWFERLRTSEARPK